MSESSRIHAEKNRANKEGSITGKPKSEFSQQGSLDSLEGRILYLQRTIGNRAVTRLIQSGTIQTKLRIAQADDLYEKEADRVVEQVMLMPAPETVCPGCIDKETIQTKGVSTRTPEFIQGVVRSTCDQPTLSPPGLLLQRTCYSESYYRSSPNFCRDDDFSPITHSGKTCYREIPRRSSYFDCPAGVHVCFDEEGICEESPDRAAIASGKETDGSCEWNYFCVLEHIIEDVLPAVFGLRWESQLDCVIAQGACTETRDAGVPTQEEIEGYNERCRRDTMYTGPDIFPTRDQCRGYFRR